jgi:multiple sugar transport system substrate-binding protein
MKSWTPRAASFLFVAGLVLTACGGGGSGGGEGPPASEGGELTFANWQWLEPNRGDAIWEAVSGYSAVNPSATLTKQEITRKDYENTLKTQLGAGQGPDILVVPDSFFPELADANLLEPLDGVLAPEDEARLNATNEAGVLEGQRLALSWEVVNYALFWNQEILDRAGVTPPTTPDELVTAARTITERTGVPGFFVRHQMNEETPWWTDFANWPYGFGGSWSTGGTLTIDSPENIAAVTAYKQAYDSGAFAVGDDASTARSKFAEGNLGMMIDNSSALYTMVNGNEAVPSSAVGASALPFPQPASANVGVYIGINANSENKALAKDYLKWMFTPEAQTALASALAPSTIGTDAEAPQQFATDNPWVEAFAQQTASRSAVVEGLATKTPQVRKAVLTQVERVLTQNVDPAEALRQAQQDAQAAVG